MDRQPSTIISWQHFQRGVLLLGLLWIYLLTHLMDETFDLENGENFWGSPEQTIIVVELEIEYLQFSQTRGVSSKLAHKLTMLVISGRMLTLLRKDGTDLNWCSSCKITRWQFRLFSFNLKNCLQYFFEIILNGETMWRRENTNPRTFNNVKVWAARSRHGFPPADAIIESPIYENLGNVYPVVCIVIVSFSLYY